MENAGINILQVYLIRFNLKICSETVTPVSILLEHAELIDKLAVEWNPNIPETGKKVTKCFPFFHKKLCRH